MSGDSDRARWDKLGTICSLVIAASGIAALFLVYAQLKESHDQARIQHLVEIVRQFDESPLAEARRSLAKKRIDEKKNAVLPLDLDDPPEEMYTVLNFFEHIALLERRGYLDKDDILDEFGYWMFNFYGDIRPLVDDEQKTNPATFADFSQLMEDLRALDIRENSGLDSHPSQQEIFNFYSEEAISPAGAPLPKSRRKRPK